MALPPVLAAPGKAFNPQNPRGAFTGPSQLLPQGALETHHPVSHDLHFSFAYIYFLGESVRTIAFSGAFGVQKSLPSTQLWVSNLKLPNQESALSSFSQHFCKVPYVS